MEKLSCFKAYDIRGKLGSELTDQIAYRIGRAFGQYLTSEIEYSSSEVEKPATVVVGGDARETSESLKHSVASGLMDAGVNVIDIGMTGTEEVYYATQAMKISGGVEVTASHNPIDYNGMKLVREDSKPVSGDSGLQDIQELAELNQFKEVKKKGQLAIQSHLDAYSDHLMTYITASNIKPLKLVVNSGNGAAGHVIDMLESKFKTANIPIELIKLHHQPDSTFPNGIPNPLLIENRADTISAVIEHQADMGIAWDGDFDRCFLFDEKGQFVEGYYIVGLLAEAFLNKHPNSKIIHDPRLTWNTIDIVQRNKGRAILSKTGHAFIKERMRKEDAIYGGEMSAHHYFRDFAYCDSGMIPWMLISELLCVKGAPLSSLVSDRIAAYPSSGEINSKLDDPKSSIASVIQAFEKSALSVDHTDGVSMEFSDWRFNLRSSNTEPVVRLNVESRGKLTLMQEKTQHILELLEV